MKNKNHLIFGLSGALITIVLFLIQYFMEIPMQNGFFRWLPMLILLGVVILGCINFSKINGGDVTFGEVFGNGFRITAIITVIAAIFFIIFVQIFPEFKDRVIEEALTSGPRMGSEEDMEKGVEMMRKNFSLLMVGGTIFWDLLLGVIGSLIGAAIAKKKQA